MKIYRKIVIGISVILGIAVTILAIWNNPVFRILGTEHPNQDDFKLLQEYSLMVAENLNTEIIPDEDVEATYKISKRDLIVEVKSLKYGYSVVSVYPVSDYTVDAESAQIRGIIQYEKVEHENYIDNTGPIPVRENKIEALLQDFLMSVVAGLLIILVVYGLLYVVPKEVMDNVRSIIERYNEKVREFKKNNEKN